jgi:hypothetical protein
MKTRRAALGLGGLAALGLAGSAAHQVWLDAQEDDGPAFPKRQPIPRFDLRGSGVVAHAAARRDEVRALRRARLGDLTPLAEAGIVGADKIARNWLKRARLALSRRARRRRRGVRDERDLSAQRGLRRGPHDARRPHARRARRAAPAHARLAVSGARPQGRGLAAKELGGRLRQSLLASSLGRLFWPGSVGVLTVMAPGRFAAAINQAPTKRRVRVFDAAGLDALLASLSSLASSGRQPALHVLRRVFEEAPDFAAAKAMLEREPVASPVIFTLVGVKPDETCVIERTETESATHMGVSSAANAWRYSRFPGSWHGGADEEDDDWRGDSPSRRRAIEAHAARKEKPFAWARPPVLNGYTRLAIEADPSTGRLLALGYEQSPDDEDRALPATLRFDAAFRP